MRPASVLTEPAGVHDMPHTMMHPSERANATSSGSMTPRSHAHAGHPNTHESTSSHDADSPVFQLSSSEASQYRRPDANNPDFSPISSQEHGSSASLVSPIQEETAGTDFPQLHRPSHPSAKSESPKKEDFARDLTSGQKRTASGQMKRSSITNIEDLKKEQATTRHSRTSSLLSNSSTGSVMEVRRRTGAGCRRTTRSANSSSWPISLSRSRTRNANHAPSFLSNSEPVFPMLCTRYKRAIHLNRWKSWRRWRLNHPDHQHPPFTRADIPKSRRGRPWPAIGDGNGAVVTDLMLEAKATRAVPLGADPTDRPIHRPVRHHDALSLPRRTSSRVAVDDLIPTAYRTDRTRLALTHRPAIFTSQRRVRARNERPARTRPWKRMRWRHYFSWPAPSILATTRTRVPRQNLT